MTGVRVLHTVTGPYVASNSVTVFSVLDTGLGVVRSYAFDTRQPKSPVVLFDELPLPAVTAPPAPEPVADMCAPPCLNPQLRC